MWGMRGFTALQQAMGLQASPTVAANRQSPTLRSKPPSSLTSYPAAFSASQIASAACSARILLMAATGSEPVLRSSSKHREE